MARRRIVRLRAIRGRGGRRHARWAALRFASRTDPMASINVSRASAPPLRLGARSGVRLWLLAVAALVFAMVLVGGATRLTESGLSITQWKPVTGVVPPLNAADWQAEFDRYRQIPQFSRLNPDMTIEGFKTIFWWEWSHRLLARDRRRGLHPAGALVLDARRAQGRARAAGRGRDRVPGARADRRLVDGELGPERAHRGRAGAAGAASADRRRDLRRADLPPRRASASGTRARRPARLLRSRRRPSRPSSMSSSASARWSPACAPG